TVKGGHGGRGCASFHRTRWNRHGTPDGGNGGRGGDVIIQADHNLATLCDYLYQSRYEAGAGTNGSSNTKHGRRGEDVILRVPVGTVVRTQEGQLLADLCQHGQRVVVARGGAGGYGNVHFKSSTNRSPRYAEPGQPGEERTLVLELKIMADVGLVGFPNAGKSTLISAITRAHAKIASYPFTTLSPVLGLLELPDFTTAVIADLPGIVEGAHRDVGLGHEFLKHIERCSILLLLIDMAGVDQRDPGDDYRVLQEELRAYSPELAKRPQLVVANKMDLPEAAEHLNEFVTRFPGVHVVPISAREGTGLNELVSTIASMLATHGRVRS
ncbi:MAG: GTPase ObgE, partial [bacterium]|nr:GTPase ObgE [bacterium]